MARYLDLIDSPADLRKLKVDQLLTLAQEIRDELINTVAKTGGHIGPNLGVVELTIAWHYIFNSPADSLVMDVSHQCYIHKLLTGRRSRFSTIRQADGLCGFMSRAESEHDHFGAGHAGTALSAALGLAVARDLRGGSENVTALCGDGAFTCGVTFEAMNNVADDTKRLIVILNDNEWSIDKNVGAIANYFNKIVTNPMYAHLHESAERFVARIGGSKAVKFVHKVEEGLKGLAWPSTLFEEFGFTYYGPMDGHDLPTLIKTFEFLKEQKHPVMLHVITKKGKGFDLAMEKTKKFHGVGPNAYSAETGQIIPSDSRPSYSEIFGDTLVKLATENENVLAVTGAMPSGTGLERFQPKFPNRYFDVGIAEEHAVVFSAGLAAKGFKPFCAIYSTFMQRAMDAIMHDICLQNLPVVLCMDRGGLSPDDGPTHHGLFDISYLRAFPNLVHSQPKDEDEFVDMLYTASLHPGPFAIRYPRGSGLGTPIKEKPQVLPIGKGEVLRHGRQVVFIALGAMLPIAMQAAELWEKEGVSCAVINPRFIKPLDMDLILKYAKDADVICTLEDHALKGGFGSAVLEEFSDRGLSVPIARVGWPDVFIEHGNLETLRKKYGLTAAAAILKTRPFVRKK